MKFSVMQDALLDAARAANNLKERGDLGVFDLVKIETRDARVELSAASKSARLRLVIPAKVDKPGATFVKKRVLLETLNTLNEERVDVELEEKQLKLRCGTQKSSIPHSTTDWFELPKLPAVPDAAMDGAALWKMLARVMYAASEVDARPILMGVHIYRDGDFLCFEAADGYRLAYDSVANFGQPIDAVVPVHALQVLKHLLSEGIECRIYALNGCTVFEFGWGVFQIQNIEGKFPDAQNLFNVSTAGTMRIVNKDLKSALLLADVFGRDNNHKVEFRPGGASSTEIAWSAHSNERGDVSGVLAVEPEGELCDLTFNSQYLLEAIKAIPEATWVELRVTQWNKPILVECEGAQYRALLMPMG